MKTLKLRNTDIAELGNVLNVELSFERSRARNDFVKETILPALEAIHIKRTAILTTHATKGEDGKPTIVNGQYDFTPEALEKAETEYKALQGEFTELEINDNVAQHLETIKNIITNDDKKLGVEQSVVLGRIVDAIELIK